MTLTCPKKICPKNNRSCEECTKIERKWDTIALIQDLESQKKDELTTTEKCWLRLLLCSFRPLDIAEKLQNQPSTITSGLSTGIYRYVEALTNRKIEDHSQVRRFLEEMEKYELKLIEIHGAPGTADAKLNKELMMEALREFFEIRGSVEFNSDNQ